jgi:hypothetical protein
MVTRLLSKMPEKENHPNLAKSGICHTLLKQSSYKTTQKTENPPHTPSVLPPSSKQFTTGTSDAIV